MANAAKSKGTKWETEVLGFVRANGFPRAYKPRQEGWQDTGDIHAGDAVLQAKDWRAWTDAIREGLDGAVIQAAHWAGIAAVPGQEFDPIPAAVVKRARRPVGDAYVVMRLSDFVRLLDR